MERRTYVLSGCVWGANMGNWLLYWWTHFWIINTQGKTKVSGIIWCHFFLFVLFYFIFLYYNFSQSCIFTQWPVYFNWCINYIHYYSVYITITVSHIRVFAVCVCNGQCQISTLLNIFDWIYLYNPTALSFVISEATMKNIGELHHHWIHQELWYKLNKAHGTMCVTFLIKM